MYTIEYNTSDDARRFKHWIKYCLGIDVRIREEPQQAIKVMKELLHDLDSDGDFSDGELQEIRRLAVAIEDKVIEIVKD